MIFTAMFFDNWLIDNRLCVHLYESFLNAHLAVNADAELRQSINRSKIAQTQNSFSAARNSPNM